MDTSHTATYPDRFDTELKRCFTIIKRLDLNVTKDGKFVQHGVVLHPNALVTQVLRKYHEEGGHFQGNVARNLINQALQRTHSNVLQAMILAEARKGGDA